MPRRGRPVGAGRLPFGAHEALEYLLALVLVVAGAHSSGRSRVELFATAALLGLLGLVSAGPLGAWALLAPRVHRVGDIIVAAVLATSPFWSGAGSESAALAIGLAILLGGLVYMTRYPAVLPGAVRQPGERSTPPSSARLHHGARGLGRVAGGLRRAARGGPRPPHTGQD